MLAILDSPMLPSSFRQVADTRWQTGDERNQLFFNLSIDDPLALDLVNTSNQPCAIALSGNPEPHKLGAGIVLYLPSWQECDLAGNPIEGKGIQPDILVDWNQEINPTSDPVLAKAVELLSK